MARIPLLELADLNAEQRRVHEAIAGLRGGHIPTPYRATLHNPELTDKMQQLGELLRYRTSLPLRLSELAVLVVARHHASQYEWHFHAPIAIKAGIAPEAVEAIRQGGRPPLTKPDERAVHDFCAELQETKFVSAPVHARAREALGIAGLVELTALMGYYAMVAMMINAHELPLPAGAVPQLPPRS